MEAGTDPASDRVQLFAKRWMEMAQEFTSGNPGIERSVGKMWQQEETIHGLEMRPIREMMESQGRLRRRSNRSNSTASRRPNARVPGWWLVS